MLHTTANRREMFVMKERISTGKLLNLVWQEDKLDKMLLPLLEKLLLINRQIQDIIMIDYTDHLLFIIISRLPIN